MWGCAGVALGGELINLRTQSVYAAAAQSTQRFREGKPLGLLDGVRTRRTH